MKLKIHLPRESEAKITPTIRQDIEIAPRFYKRNGWVPVFYFTAVDAKGNEVQYVMTVSAGTMQVRIEKLVDVIPACDEDDVKEEDVNDSGQSDD